MRRSQRLRRRRLERGREAGSGPGSLRLPGPFRFLYSPGPLASFHRVPRRDHEVPGAHAHRPRRARPGRSGRPRRRRRRLHPPEGRDLRRDEAPEHRPGVHVRPHRGHRRPPREAEHLVRRRRQRQRLEDHERRHDLEADLRRSGLVLDRVRHDRPEPPGDDLGGHRRERRRATRRLRRRRLPEPRRGQDLGERRARRVRARRQHRRGSARLEDGVRGGAGTALVRGRGPGPLQDHGRRRDLDEDPGRRRLHRRERGPPGSPRPRRSLRRDPPALPQRRRAHQRRPGVRRAQVHRRRRHLAADRQRFRAAGGQEGREALRRRRGRPREDRSGGLARRPGRRLRDGRAVASEGRVLPLHRRRRELGEAQRLPLRGHRSALLPGDLRQPPRRRSRVPDGRADARHHRRRGDVHRGAARVQAQRQPRARLRPRRPRLSAGGLRRRHLRELGSRREVEVHRQPPDHAVLQGGRRLRRALLSRLRRHAGQQHAGWTVAHRQPQRHPKQRLGDHARGATVISPPSIPRTRTSSTPSGRSGTSVATTARPARSSTSSRSPRRARSGIASTGTRRSSSALTIPRASSSPASACGGATTAATPGRRSPAISRAAWTASSCR